jgi:ABC-type nitrate/sulfonate/bicarbonate transport system permease component
MKRCCLPWLGLLGLLSIWQGVAIAHWVNPVLLPTPIATIETLIYLLIQPDHGLLLDLFASGSRTLQAFMIAAALGVPLGIVLGSFVPVYRSVEFLVDFFRSTPPSALMPLFLILFGIGSFSQVLIAAFTAFFTILFYSAYGVMNINQSRVLAAKAMGASRFQIFKDVLIWESLPEIFVGLRSGISLSLIIIIVAEMLMGAEIGLGKRILNAQQVLNVKEMYATILLTGGLGYGLNWGFGAMARRIVHWRGN